MRKRFLPVFVAAVLVLLNPVSASETFGGGTGEPLPNVTALEVYDVSSATDKETGGTLSASGLNTTLELSQREETQYRFSFRLRNDGNDDWVIENADELFHSGLDTAWEVTKVWYNITADNDGGSFSGGRVDWDTGNNGVLRNETGNRTMYAKYLVNVSVESTSSYSQEFLVNDTSTISGSQDLHTLKVTKHGFIDVELQEPPENTFVGRYENFVMNASATCRNGECGEVSLSARYNESETADTLIPENSGTPFYTQGSNTRTCDTGLAKGEKCFLTWDVNATGTLSSLHLLDANASSTVSSIPRNDSEDHLVEIEKPVILNVTWDEIDFGVLDPGQVDRSAQNNSDLRYNVTIDPDSSSVDDLWIRATDLTSNSFDYRIPAYNLSYSLTNDIGTESFLSNSYQHVASGLSPGDVLTTYYWIDVPLGIYNGGYTGTVYFKANSTR